MQPPRLAYFQVLNDIMRADFIITLQNKLFIGAEKLYTRCRVSTRWVGSNQSLVLLFLL